MRIIYLIFIGWLTLAPWAAPATAVESDLPTKLNAEFARYEAARQKLADYYRTDSDTLAPVSRATWEAWLSGDGRQSLTDADRQALAESQHQRIALAAARAKASSPFDLDKLRARPQAQRQKAAASFCAAMPKGGMLHVHTSGTIKIPTAQHILERRNPVLPLAAILGDATTPGSGVLLYPDELMRLRALGSDAPYNQFNDQARQQFLAFFELPPGPQPFTRFDAVFAFLMPAFTDNADIAVVIDDFAHRAAAEGVIYAELRLGLAAQDLAPIAAALAHAQAVTGVTLRIDRSFFRGGSQEQMASDLADLKTLKTMPQSSWVVGTDLLGNESTAPMLESSQRLYAGLLNAAADLKLGRTVHAGEIGDLRDARDALIMAGGVGGVRLGHGVLLAKDPVALEYASRNHIPVEINLLSNLRLAGVTDIEHHPFLHYLRLGIPVSLSTDDEGVLGTDINQECEAAVLHSDASYSELKTMVYNGIDGAFLPEAEKTTLRQKLTAQFARFESQTSLQP